MKKKILLILSIMVSLLLIVSCGNKNISKEENKSKIENSEKKQNKEKNEEIIRVAAIKGPPAMGFVKLFSDSEAGKSLNKYENKIVATPDEIVALVSKGEVDIASIPSNLASVLYNKTNGKIQVASIMAFGILYVVEHNNENIKNIKDLKGKTIYANGKGATPEIVLNYILKGNGLEPGKDVKIEFKSEAVEVVNALVNDKNGVALLNQPFVTVAQSKNPNIKIAFSIEEEWDKVPNTKKGSQVSGVVIFNKEFAEKNPEKINKFLDEYEQSIKFLNENVEESAKLMEKYGLLPEKVALKAIPATKITFVEGNEMKEKISEYLKILHSAEPKIIGGKIPNDDFYYLKK